jgi:hypothetical protein
MKKCIVCGKDIFERDICKSCNNFLKWKHKGDFWRRVEEFKKLANKSPSLKLTKFRRKK